MTHFLFVRPNNRSVLYGETDEFSLAAIEPPFWPLLLASFLKRQNIEVRIVDLEVDPPNKLTHLLAHYRPTHAVICVNGHNPTASIMNMVGIDELCQKIKFQWNSKIILHGLYPSSEPNKILAEHPLVDEVLIREGFKGLLSLVGYNRSDDVTINDIGEIDWGLIDITKYRAHNWHCFGDISNRSPYGIVFSSFGCPHKCDFCCVNLMYTKVQLRDVHLVYQDIKNLYDRGVRNFKFMDELFTMSRNRVVELCHLIIESGMGDINAWAYARTDTIDKERVKLMRKAGIRWLAIGYESGSQLILDSSDKKQNLKKAYQVTEICKNNDMHICGNFMFGLEDDTHKTMMDTLQLAIDLQPEWANFNSVSAFPGTKLYDKVKDEPWFYEPIEYEEYSQHGYACHPMGTRYLTPKQVLAFKDYAFREFYQNENYLNVLQSKFGLETREYVEKSLIYYPKRKLYED